MRASQTLLRAFPTTQSLPSLKKLSTFSVFFTVAMPTSSKLRICSRIACWTRSQSQISTRSSCYRSLKLSAVLSSSTRWTKWWSTWNFRLKSKQNTVSTRTTCSRSRASKTLQSKSLQVALGPTWTREQPGYQNPWGAQWISLCNGTSTRTRIGSLRGHLHTDK